MPPVDLSLVNCVQYARVSTDQQAGEKQTSIADQRTATAALAAKLGRTVGHLFQDTGLSGATMDKRPALKALIASCLAAPKPASAPGYVLVLNDSRWGRFPDPEEATYWRFHLSKAGWIVRFAENDETESKTVRAIMRAVVSGQATQKRDDVRANARRGAKGSAEQGYWIGQAPFGYRRKVVYPIGRERVLDTGARKAPDEKMILVPHDAEAAMVRDLFARYASGQHSMSSITEWAVAQWPGRLWNKASIRYMLRNPAYVGDLVWGRTPADDSERAVTFVRPESEWYGRRDAHEPLVARSIFATVAALMERNRARPRGVRSEWVVSGIVSCRCGKAFAGGGKGGRMANGSRVPVYHCTTRGAHPSGRCPYPGSIVKHYLEDAVLESLMAVIGTVTHRRDLTSIMTRVFAATKRLVRTVDDVDRDMTASRDRQRRIMTAIEDGVVSSIEARDRVRAIRDEQLALTAERERIESRSRSTTDKQERARLIALAADFRAAAAKMKGPALRELIRPWIKRAVFNTETRELMIEIRRIPAMAGVSEPSSAQFGVGPDRLLTKTGTPAKRAVDRTIVRTVTVGKRRAGGAR